MRREDVIKALECCNNLEGPKCHECPTGGPGFGYACRDNVRMAALVLLKEREPRVMALEEAKKLKYNMVVWFEQPPINSNVFPEIVYHNDGKSVEFKDRTQWWFKEDHYGYKWRLWTQKPTDAQREAVKWK